MFQKGHPQGPGRGPAKGAPNAGRPPNEFVQSCAGLAREVVLKKVTKYLATKGPSDAAWRWCADYVTERGMGKALQPVEHSGEIIEHVAEAREAFESRMARLASRFATADFPRN